MKICIEFYEIVFKAKLLFSLNDSSVFKYLEREKSIPSVTICVSFI